MSEVTAGLIFTAVIALALATWRAPRITSILVWAMIATLLIVSAISMNLPGDVVNKLVGLALFLPLIWVGLQFWCFWDPSKWRVAGGLITICIVSGGIVAISTPLG